MRSLADVQGMHGQVDHAGNRPGLAQQVAVAGLPGGLALHVDRPFAPDHHRQGAEH
jgi:hypothetical protein